LLFHHVEPHFAVLYMLEIHFRPFGLQDTPEYPVIVRDYHESAYPSLEELYPVPHVLDSHLALFMLTDQVLTAQLEFIQLLPIAIGLKIGRSVLPMGTSSRTSGLEEVLSRLALGTERSKELSTATRLVSRGSSIRACSRGPQGAGS
jgi:hypothetical protein